MFVLELLLTVLMHLIENPDRKFTASNSTQKFGHSVYGNDILKNFAFGICGAKGDWSMANFVDMQIAQIRETVGDRKSFLASQWWG